MDMRFLSSIYKSSTNYRRRKRRDSVPKYDGISPKEDLRGSLLSSGRISLPRGKVLVTQGKQEKKASGRKDRGGGVSSGFKYSSHSPSRGCCPLGKDKRGSVRRGGDLRGVRSSGVYYSLSKGESSHKEKRKERCWHAEG